MEIKGNDRDRNDLSWEFPFCAISRCHCGMMKGNGIWQYNLKSGSKAGKL